MEKNKVFIALDSDILRSLADLDDLLSEDPKYNTKTSRDFFIRDHGLELKKMLSMIRSGQLSVFVGSTIFREISHRENCVNFIKKHCYLPKINASNFAEVVSEADNLALKYCSQKYIYEGREYYPPMELHYNAYLKRAVPSNDAYAMAEAAMVRCVFVTNNGQDFIFRKKFREDKNSRSVGIMSINEQEGYYSIDEGGRKIIPKPFEFSFFLQLLKKGIDKVYLPTVDDEKFEKASFAID